MVRGKTKHHKKGLQKFVDWVVLATSGYHEGWPRISSNRSREGHAIAGETYHPPPPPPSAGLGANTEPYDSGSHKTQSTPTSDRQGPRPHIPQTGGTG
jgi:hypothetical protein